MTGLTKVLLIDSNPKYLKNILPYYGYDVTCIGEEQQAAQILKMPNNFDIILLDININRKSDWNLLKYIKNNLESKYIPLIVISSNSEEKNIVLALKQGADDYIIKPFSLPILLARIETVLRRCIKKEDRKSTENVTNNQINKFNSLTEREKDVLLLVTQGENNKSVADKLVLSEVTVKSHLSNIYKKLKVANRVQAVLFTKQFDKYNELLRR